VYWRSLKEIAFKKTISEEIKMKKQTLSKKLFLAKETIASLSEQTMLTIKAGTDGGTPTKIIASCHGDSICGCTNETLPLTTEAC
jgi:hypothetical protein